jgi:FMN phosphatase YigB (HAD superfamily)
MRKALEALDARMKNEERAAFAFSQELGISEAQALIEMNTMAREAFSHLSNCFTPIKGAKEFIEWASPRYQLVLATNPVWPKEIVLLRLSWSGIPAEHFKFVTHAENMHSCKPHIEYYSELLKHLEIQADSAMMIGDSKKKDLPALKIGIATVILKNKSGFKKLRKLLEKEQP